MKTTKNAKKASKTTKTSNTTPTATNDTSSSPAPAATDDTIASISAAEVSETRELIESASKWRAKMRVTILAFHQKAELGAVIEQGLLDCSWRRLSRNDGTPFESLADFCNTPAPDGLGIPHETVVVVIREHFGEKMLALVEAPRSSQGKRLRAPEGTKRPPSRTASRRRTIAEGPAVVKMLSTLGVITDKEAEKLARPTNAAEMKGLAPKLETLVEEARRATPKPADLKRKAPEVFEQLTATVRKTLTTANLLATKKTSPAASKPAASSGGQKGQDPTSRSLALDIPAVADLILDRGVRFRLLEVLHSNDESPMLRVKIIEVLSTPQPALAASEAGGPETNPAPRRLAKTNGIEAVPAVVAPQAEGVA